MPGEKTSSIARAPATMEFPTEEPKAPTSYPMSTLPKWVQFDRKVRLDSIAPGQVVVLAVVRSRLI